MIAAAQGLEKIFGSPCEERGEIEARVFYIDEGNSRRSGEVKSAFAGWLNQPLRAG
jgi:hypothetical protein